MLYADFYSVTTVLKRNELNMSILIILLTGEYWQSGQWLLNVQPYEWGWRVHPIWLGGWGLAMMLGMMCFWALIIGACIFGLRWLLTHPKSSPQDHAMTILRERFARGEIDKDEFETRKQQLS